MNIQVAIFWVMTQSTDVGYQRFGGPCCLHLQDASGRQHGPPKRLYSVTSLHGVTT